jgi:hypothetical protein
METRKKKTKKQTTIFGLDILPQEKYENTQIREL